MNSFKRFSEDELPDKSKFFSSLKDSGVNEKEYKKAVNVWKVFKIKNPCHCFSNPGLSWDEMLKMTGIKFLSDVNIHLFIEKGMRGGISYTSKKTQQS